MHIQSHRIWKMNEPITFKNLRIPDERCSVEFRYRIRRDILRYYEEQEDELGIPIDVLINSALWTEAFERRDIANGKPIHDDRIKMINVMPTEHSKDRSGSNWRYCVVGNIKTEYTDANGVVRHGCRCFPGGRKVYLSNRLWVSDGEVTVMGLNRFKSKYELDRVPLDIIENIRCRRIYKPRVLELMNDHETKDMWWGNSAADRRKAERYVSVCLQVSNLWRSIVLFKEP